MRIIILIVIIVMIVLSVPYLNKFLIYSKLSTEERKAYDWFFNLPKDVQKVEYERSTPEDKLFLQKLGYNL